MCGIAGIVSLDGEPVAPQRVAGMCAAMVHRGPDDEGVHVGPGVGLGMRRLSIIDLATGHQPVANEDGTVWAILNGEIYDYRDHRRALEAKGHRFRTASDTETIVHLYEEHGPACVEHLRGMFALAVWDARRRRLLLARDRIGIKPLYYTLSERRLAFASELKALLTLPDVERRVDVSALDHLLAFLTTPADRSILEGIRKLEPAHRLVLDVGTAPRIERYWEVRFEPEPARVETLVDALRDALLESTRAHLVSDVPVGAFLSGGIDSSTVVAMAARAGARRLQTFSVGFHERDFDELRWAREVARRFGTEHHETILTPDALPSLDEIVWHLDEPFGDSSALPTWVVSKLAATEVKVVLSGDGGDEIFGGYDRYVVEGRERRLDFLPAGARALFSAAASALPPGARGRGFLRHRALAGEARYLDAATLFRREDRLRLLHPDLRPVARDDDATRSAARALGGRGHWLSTLQAFDLSSYLPLDVLTKVDRMSMAHSLETRVPLCDHRLVELCARIPASMHLRGGTTKWLLKRAMKGILPDEILDRPKRGFAVPLGRWMRGALGGFAREVLLDGARRRGFFVPSEVERWLEPGRGRDLDLHTWTLLSFEIWCRLFLDRAPRAAAA